MTWTTAEALWRKVLAMSVAHDKHDAVNSVRGARLVVTALGVYRQISWEPS
jgi:hypothetical protein